MLRENLMVGTISVPRSSFLTKALDVIYILLGKAACGIIVLGVIEGNLPKKKREDFRPLEILKTKENALLWPADIF